MFNIRLLKTAALITLFFFSWCSITADFAFADRQHGEKQEEGKTDKPSAEQVLDKTKTRGKTVSDSRTNIIEKEGKKKKPRLLWWVIAGVVVVVVVILLLSKKKYTLAVTLDEGVVGTPGRGTQSYKKGKKVHYSFNSKTGYANLQVLLDGKEVPPSGTITMDSDHVLTATTRKNEVTFVTDKDEIKIREGETATFNVKLSAHPRTNVDATVSVSNDNSDIRILSGSTLSFSTSSWDRFQEVRLQAANDDNAIHGEAAIAINAPEIPHKTIIAGETDKDIDTPPTVWISKPEDGDIVYGYVTIQADATDDRGINKVEFYIDGTKEKTVKVSPYTYEWPTRSVSLGRHHIKVIASDTSDQTDEKEITVSLINKSPFVKLSIYPNITPLRGTVQITVDASDDRGIKVLHLSIDGNTIWSWAGEVPSTKVWTGVDFVTTDYPNGSHTITVKVKDTEDQEKIEELPVTVEN